MYIAKEFLSSLMIYEIRYENLLLYVFLIYRRKITEPKIQSNCVLGFIASLLLTARGYAKRAFARLQTKLSVLFLIRRRKANYLDLRHDGKSRASIIIAR